MPGTLPKKRPRKDPDDEPTVEYTPRLSSARRRAKRCGKVSELPSVFACAERIEVALAKVTRERDEAQDRNECIVCMERPRAVLFMPCKHLLVCATCAAAADACPWCPARAVEGRITVANSS